MAEKTACGLDCYDACRIIAENEKITGDKAHPPGNGALCAVLNKYIDDAERIAVPMVDGKEVGMEEAMSAVAEAFKEDKSLLWRGSGNVGVMQEITDLFMEQIEGSLTKGSLCDGAGAAGIEEGRGVNRTLPLEQIEMSEVVVVWGRDVTVSNSHLMPYLEGKKAYRDRSGTYRDCQEGRYLFADRAAYRLLCRDHDGTFYLYGRQ